MRKSLKRTVYPGESAATTGPQDPASPELVPAPSLETAHARHREKQGQLSED